MEANTRNAETPVFSGVSGLLRMQANDEEVDREGIEPTTHGFSVHCSTN